MFRKKVKSRNSFLILHSSNRGSDIVKPENTSLIVNESDTEGEDLPKGLTSIFSDEEDNNLTGTPRKSSLLKSLSQKKQSTPLGCVSKESETSCSPKFKEKNSELSHPLGSSIKKISYFDEVLKACGACPLPANSSYLMSEDQAIFSIKVSKILNEKPENKQKFINSFEEKIKNSENLQKLLSHTLTAESCEVARGPVQEPLVRMLLQVSCIQAELVELILNLIANYVISNNKENENVQLVSSILHQLRFLNERKNVKIASRLFEIIHIAANSIKKEIIFLLPEIISEEETEESCVQLINLLKFDELLTHVIVDALTNLPLGKTLQSKVCSKIMKRLDKSPVEFLPSLVQFLLNKSDAENINEVINGLRKNLPFTIEHFQMNQSASTCYKKNPDEDSFVKLIFENIKFSVMASKQITDAWIKVIADVQFSKDFRCLDLIMLVIFYCCLGGRKSQILQLVRNKIKLSVLTRGHVKNMLKTLFVIAEEYFSSILELSSALVKSFDSKISDFGAGLYKECFIHFNFFVKQIVISEILLLVGTGLPTTVNTALRSLTELCKQEKESLSQHTTSIMGLMIKIQDLDLSLVRILMDVIAELVFFDSAGRGTAAQDELQIFIRKYLMSPNSEQCKKGISAAIIYGKHFVGQECPREEINLTQINSLLEMAMGFNGSSEFKRGFFNDEFATVIKESRLSKSFLNVWSNKTSNLVMENLFAKKIDLQCADFPLSPQYCLEEGAIGELVFPVVEFINKNCQGKRLNVSVSVIPSTLRLLWNLKGSKMLPAFCAPVIMPDTTVYDKFNSFEETHKKKIMSCLFLCGNYLIECINALCASGFFDKALVRVKQLIQIRRLIAKNITMISNFVPPLCQFHVPAQKVFLRKKTSENKEKKNRKRKLDESIQESLSNSSADSQAVGFGTSTERNIVSAELSVVEADLQIYSRYFREMDCLTHKLLAIDFNQKANTKMMKVTKATGCLDDESYLSFQPEKRMELDIGDTLFLLEDLIYKAEQILKYTDVISNFKSKSVTNSLVHKMGPENFIEASLDILPGLLIKMDTFSKYCENLLESNDWVYESRGLHLHDSSNVKLAMAAGLKFIAEIICWKEFENPNNKYLKDLMLILSSKKSSTQESPNPESLGTLTFNAVNYLATFGKTVLVLSGGLSIIKIFQACVRHSSPKPCTALADLCYEFLRRKWFTVSGTEEKGSCYNQHVDFLLKTYFFFVDKKLETVRIIAKTSLEEVSILKEKNSFLNTFKTINKANFPLLYRTLCEALVSASADELSKMVNDDCTYLEVWNKVVETLLILVETAKIHSSRVILASLLKRSHSIIQLFLSKGMLVVQSALRVKSVEVLTLLKSFQMVTRFLHSICCHSRITSDSLVAAHVPAIRSLCERLTLEVKGMLILNGIPMECITIAILKNRDIKGNDIISQESLEEGSDDESELPPEDTPDIEENLEENINNATGETYSEDY